MLISPFGGSTLHNLFGERKFLIPNKHFLFHIRVGDIVWQYLCQQPQKLCHLTSSKFLHNFQNVDAIEASLKWKCKPPLHEAGPSSSMPSLVITWDFLFSDNPSDTSDTSNLWDPQIMATFYKYIHINRRAQETLIPPLLGTPHQLSPPKSHCNVSSRQYLPQVVCSKWWFLLAVFPIVEQTLQKPLTFQTYTIYILDFDMNTDPMLWLYQYWESLPFDTQPSKSVLLSYVSKFFIKELHLLNEEDVDLCLWHNP